MAPRPKKPLQIHDESNSEDEEFNNELDDTNRPFSTYLSQPSPSSQFQSQYSSQYQPQFQPQFTPQFQPQFTPQFSPQFQSQYRTGFSNLSPQFTQQRQSSQPTQTRRAAKGKSKQNTTPMRTNSTSGYWSNLEDQALARAYVNISENAEVGRDQKGNEFYKKISEMVKQDTGSVRDPKSCSNRMDLIKRKLHTWKIASDKCDQEYVSGENEMGRIQRIMTRYTDMTGSNFNFSHVADILMECAKFNYTTTDGISNTSNSEGTGGSTPSTGGSGTKRSRDDYTSLPSVDEGEYTSPRKVERPLGTKSTKKSKAKTKLVMDDDDVVDFSESNFKDREFRERKLSLMENMFIFNKERAEQKKNKRAEQAARREEAAARDAARRAEQTEREAYVSNMAFLQNWNEAQATDDMRILKQMAMDFVMAYHNKHL